MNVALLKNLWQAFNEDKVMRLASSIAFTAIFSIAPLLVILIAIIGWIIGIQNGGHGHHLAESALLNTISKNAGKATADSIESMVSASFDKPRQSIIAQVVGWAAFLVGASALFSSLQDALNAIWRVEATRGGWKQMLRDRAASFGMILVVGLLLLMTFIANAGIAFIAGHMPAAIPIVGSPAVLAIIEQLVALLLATVVFALIYKVLPDVNIAWHDVWVGAAVTAVLFVFGEALISWYLAVAGAASAYGAAGSLLVGLLWIYYSSIILLIGAEFTKVAAHKAATTTATSVRTLTDQPAGIDPRQTGNTQ